MTDQELAQIVWDYMNYQQPLKKSDVVIGLGGDGIGVARYVASLYKQGYAPLVMFCGATGRLTPAGVASEADWYAEEAIRLGVPDEAILRESRSTNTGENILFAHELLMSKDIKINRAIVVHEPYMLRRDYATVLKQWPGDALPEFIFSAEPVSLAEYIEQSKPFETVVTVMVGDLQRIKEYPKLGFQIEQEIPEEIWSAYKELVVRGYTRHLLS